MKSSHRWLIRTSLILSAALLIGAMAWLTRAILNAERQRDLAEARAEHQELVRLSLWRMDAAGTRMILAESRTNPTAPNNSIPSHLRFDLSNDHQLTTSTPSPKLDTLLTKITPPGNPALFTLFSQPFLAAGPTSDKPENLPAQEASNHLPETPPLPFDRLNATDQHATNLKEQTRRSLTFRQAIRESIATHSATPGSSNTEASPPLATWIHGELFLLRTITPKSSDTPTSIHGLWIDSEKLTHLLLSEITDLLPAATLRPIPQSTADGLALASFPFRIDPGPSPSLTKNLRTPILAALILGWSAAILAIAATTLLILAIVRLGERRAAFVSSVTHELRTPLTTFRLYADMLESGAVKEEKRNQYLRILSHEADRLSHLVENVLAFSRIERVNIRRHLTPIPLPTLIENLRERLAARLATAGMSLEITQLPQITLHTDPNAVEHILFNIIDNAAKYAGQAHPPTVLISAETSHDTLAIHVTDNGPGVPEKDRTRIFKAFHKSATQAAESKPGVGLGLALSRRLAKSLRATLTHSPNPTGPGARFTLTLPLKVFTTVQR